MSFVCLCGALYDCASVRARVCVCVCKCDVAVGSVKSQMLNGYN